MIGALGRRPLVRVAALGRPHAARLAVAAVAGALAVGAGMGLLFTSGELISHAALRPPILALSVAIVGVRFFGISRAVLRYLERLAGHDATLRVLGTLRVRLFARLEPLVPGDLGLARGDLLSRFVADVDQLQELWLRALGPFSVAMVAGLGATGLALAFSPPAAAALAASLAMGGIVVPLAGAAAARAAASREAPARALLAGELVEALAAAPELAAFGASPAAAWSVEQADRALGRSRRRTALTLAVSEGVITALAGLAAVAVLAVAVPQVRDGGLGGVFLGALGLLALAAFEAVRPLPAAAAELARTRAAATRVLELTDRRPSVTDPASPSRAGGPGRVQLEGVRIRLDRAGPWVLDGIDLTLEPGEVVALTGPSGGGKTTLAELLVRFRDPDAGSVTLDGCDLRTLVQEDVRRAVALAGQDAHLFATSIRENLRIGRPEAADGELYDALRLVHLDAFVDGLPEGLDTHVGEEGAYVSGGQRQRLALARALLARPRLVVLDEPDAHLDEATAGRLLTDMVAAVRRSGAGLLLITHRPVALGLADSVLELRDGRLHPLR